MAGDARRLSAAGSAGRIAVAASWEGSLRQALEAEGDIAVAAVITPDGRMTRLHEGARLDAVVLEIARAASEVYQVVRALRRAYPDTRVIVANAPDDPAVLLDAVEAGVRGYAPSDQDDEQLRRVVRVVVRGEVAIPRRLLDAMLELLMERRVAREQTLRRVWTLSDRERTVLALLTKAQSNEAIGGALKISPQTVRKHVQNVLAKLEVHSRLQAVSLVHRFHLEDQLTA